MQLTLNRATLENLLNHAASAAQLVGHLDGAIAAGPLGDHIDAVVHGLTEILSEARTLVVPDAAAPDLAHDGMPMLVATAGGAGPVSRRDDLDVDDTLHALRGGAS